MQIRKARAIDLAAATGRAEQGLVDLGAGKSTNLRADGRAGQRRAENGKSSRQQCAANGRAERA